jgi:hypothetical protein
MTAYTQLVLEYAAFAMLLTSRLPGVGNPPERGTRPALAIDEVNQSWPGVFFRLFLAVPAYIVGTLFVAGASIYAIVMWFAELFTRRAPESLHVANALAVRFYVRFVAYALLLTPTQPFEHAFGDVILPTGAAEAPAAPADVAHVEGHPAVVPRSVEEASPDEDATPGSPEPHEPWAVSSTSWALSRAAVLIGVVALVAYSLVGVTAYRSVTSDTTSAKIATNVVLLEVALELGHMTRAIASCTTLACVQSEAQTAQSSVLGFLDTYEKSAAATSPPQPEFENYLLSIEGIATQLAGMSTATTVRDAKLHFLAIPGAYARAHAAREQLLAAF